MMPHQGRQKNMPNILCKKWPYFNIGSLRGMWGIWFLKITFLGHPVQIICYTLNNQRWGHTALQMVERYWSVRQCFQNCIRYNSFFQIFGNWSLLSKYLKNICSGKSYQILYWIPLLGTLLFKYPNSNLSYFSNIKMLCWKYELYLTLTQQD